jgi:site-specific recombinase XerD
MPSLFKRSNGVYYIKYTCDGKIRWRSTGQRLKSLAFQSLLNFKNILQQPRARITFLQFERDFLGYASATYSHRTVALYRRILFQFRAITGDIQLSLITPQHVDMYKAKRLESVGPSSLNVELRTLRAAFYTAVRWRLLAENPLKRVPLLHTPEQQPAYLTKGEFQKLLSVIPESWFREFLVIAVSTGLRRAELINLTWENIDFERRLIHVQSGASFRTKGGKRRSIPMSESVFQLLCQKVHERVGEYVFTFSGKKVEENLVTHKFKDYARSARLSEKLHLHCTRHTFATWLVQEGVSIYEVQKLLGHSNISVTQVYSHLAASELHGAVNKICVSLN